MTDVTRHAGRRRNVMRSFSRIGPVTENGAPWLAWRDRMNEGRAATRPAGD